MANALNILFVSAECVPFAKTGGLGDVIGSLPVFLKKLGHNPCIIIPKYSFIDNKKYGLRPILKKINVPIGDDIEYCNVLKTETGENVPVYFIDYKPYFNREGLYYDNNYNDYDDNPKRFTFFSKAALQLCSEINFKPDIIHANDWHTAIIPAFLKTLYKNDPVLGHTASVLTIHNIAYQGRYASYYFDYTGLGWDNFTSDKFECFNAINFLKGGIQFADIVNTVSRGYASETKTHTGGFGLDKFLRNKGENYIGILNGVDYTQWDPAIDKLIPENYNPSDLRGKAACKKVLQKKLGLKQYANVALIGIVSRFVDQKGFYLLSECIDSIINNMNVQFAILGAGDKQLETFYGTLPLRYNGKVGTYIGYNNELAHLIEAGSDFILMPSLYEPCGLNQIYSLKYGTLPIVRAIGGLDDTVENYDQETGKGTGFKFWEPSSKAIYHTIEWALDTYYIRKQHLKMLIKNAMQQHFSWEESASEYVKLYNRAIKNKKYIKD